MNHVSRRRFLKITGAGAGVAAAAGTFGSLPGLRAAKGPVEKGLRTVPTFCDLCFWKCNAIATVRDGVLWKIEGNPDDPLSRGRLCPRGTGGVGAHFDTDRLRAPLLRASVRGEEKWTEVTWDEALGHVAEKMLKIKAEHGPEARRPLQPRPRRDLPQAHAEGLRLAELGRPVLRPVPRPARRGLRADLRRGGRLARAHRHPERPLPRPHRLAPRREHAQHAGAGVRRRDRQRGDDHRGRPALLGRGEQGEALPADQAGHRPRAPARLDERARRARGSTTRTTWPRTASASRPSPPSSRRFTPEWAYPETGIEPAVIRETAREMARHRPATLVHPGRHATWYGDDAQRGRAIALLNALLGSWGRKGGFYQPASMNVPAYPYPPYPKSEKGKVDNPGPPLPLRERGDHHRHPRGHDHRQAVPGEGLARLRDEPDAGAAERGGDDQGHPGPRPAGRGRRRRAARSRAGPTSCCPRRRTSSGTTS